MEWEINGFLFLTKLFSQDLTYSIIYCGGVRVLIEKGKLGTRFKMKANNKVLSHFD